MKKTARQETVCTSQPPRTGPNAEVMVVKPDHVPIACPRWSSSNEALMMARLPGTRSAPPTPCTARATTSCVTLGASPHHTEASVKSATPAAKMRRRPR